MDLDAMRRGLEKLHRVSRKRADRAKQELVRVLADADREYPQWGRKRRISLLLEGWQLRAIRLVSDILGGTYQERLRTYIDLGIRADARRSRDRDLR